MAALLFLVLWAGPVLALDSLRVGSEGQSYSWKDIQESARFLAVARDSIWTWDVEPYADLAPETTRRQGSMTAKVRRPSGPFGSLVDALDKKPGLLTWIDGNPGTAWSPEEDEELGRQAELYLDLGGTFGVNRIRFFPRLDTDHRGLVLGSFEIATSDRAVPRALVADYQRLLAFTEAFPNRQTVVDQRFPSRQVRYLRLTSQEKEPWEIAELEVYADGTVPEGEFASVPLFVRGGSPIWGRVLANGISTDRLPITIQTRTGPDEEPLNYFIKRGDELERVSKKEYDEVALRRYITLGVVEEEQGPILPNPDWSPWQTVSDGRVVSPGPQRYLQFRVLLLEPGTVLRDLIFEYVKQPLAGELQAEISPTEVEPGQETEFTLSLEVHIDQARRDTGVRYLQILTPAQVSQVEQVRVDDQEAVYTATYQRGEGFTVDLWQRVVQSGSFVQVVFRASLFRDGTPFQVRAVDLRPVEGQLETVYQAAREGDVDPVSVGGQLVVRFRSSGHALIEGLPSGKTLFTPNGDGVNDFFAVSYGLFKLIAPAPVRFAIFDLQGRRVRQGDVGAELSGTHVRVWDGTDAQGARVLPGIYLYRIEVDADTGPHSWQGAVQVGY